MALSGIRVSLQVEWVEDLEMRRQWIMWVLNPMTGVFIEEEKKALRYKAVKIYRW